jgi:hypothetical protein
MRTLALKFARGRSLNSPRSISEPAVDDVLHRIIGREHAGRVFDFARRIEFEDCEARKHCDGNRSKAHGGGS